jgi:GNAT superfamily N-acetyltransferase
VAKIAAIQKLTELPKDFSALEAEATREGFRFLEKLRTEWESGRNCFNQPGEVVFGVFAGEKLIAIGGLNIDTFVNEAFVGRIRHLYTSKEYRRKGLGTTLIQKLIEHGTKTFKTIRLRTDTTAAAKFYEGMGFRAINDETATHEWTPET